MISGSGCFLIRRISAHCPCAALQRVFMVVGSLRQKTRSLQKTVTTLRNPSWSYLVNVVAGIPIGRRPRWYPGRFTGQSQYVSAGDPGGSLS